MIADRQNALLSTTIIMASDSINISCRGEISLLNPLVPSQYNQFLTSCWLLFIHSVSSFGESEPHSFIFNINWHRSWKFFSNESIDLAKQKKQFVTFQSKQFIIVQ